MPKRSWLFPLIVVLAVISLLQGCEKPEKEAYVIGLINPNKGACTMVEAFVSSMEEYGFVEGENVSYIRVGEMDAIEREAGKMVDQRVDLIVTVTTPATKIAKKVTSESKTPVLFSMYDPMKAKVINQIQHPGGNLTGIKMGGSTPKALEWLTTVVPGAAHIYVPISFDTKAAELSLEDLRDAAQKLNIKVTVQEVTDLKSLQSGLDSMPKGTDAIMVLHSILIASNVDVISTASLKHKVPVVAGLAKYKDGATVTYASDYYYIGKQMSRMASKILQGTNPADMPMESVDYFLGINLKSADQIGLSIPDEILKQADYIVR